MAFSFHACIVPFVFILINLFQVSNSIIFPILEVMNLSEVVLN
jgi:hypothetical protein